MNKFTIGVDVGGTNVKLGLVDPGGKILDRSRFATKPFLGDKNELIRALGGAIEDIIDKNRIKKNNVAGIGLGLPGLIDLDKGVVEVLPNIPGWEKTPLVSILRKNLRLPVYIDNDVNVITLAEWKMGAGKGYENLVCITLGTGVGGGLILNNEIYRGEGFVAGEIGHIPYRSKVLEAYVGNKSIQKMAARVFAKKDIKIEDLHDLAKNNNRKAIEIWQTVGEAIGTTLAGVVNVLNPRLIVIGGGVSNNFGHLKRPISETLKAKAMAVQARMVKVVRAQLGDDAGILGARILVESMTKLS